MIILNLIKFSLLSKGTLDTLKEEQAQCPLSASSVAIVLAK